MAATHFTNGFANGFRVRFSEKEKNYLVDLARKAIKNFLKTKEILEINPKKLPKKLLERHGIFVTIYKNGFLRGCVGNIYPKNPVYMSVIQNSIVAAFDDSRFLPLKAEELKNIKIEISILTNPKKLVFSSPEDLLEKISGKEGVVFLKKGYSATFLPKVWESIPKKEEFFSQLCLKAGLQPLDWKEKGAEIYVYHALVLRE